MGELKKKASGKTYVYYRCTGMRGRCEQGYVRQEVLDQAFEEVVKAVTLSPTDLEWLRGEILTSHEIEQKTREEAVDRFQRRYNDLDKLIARAYEDRVLGKIDEALWESQTRAWRLEQQEIQSQLARLRKAEDLYLQEGLKVLELAQRMHGLFVASDRPLRRELLEVLTSNCTLRDVSVVPTYRKPYNLLAEGNRCREWGG